MAKRFTEAEKQAALMDLKGGMTLEQASKKHKCSTASLMQWKKVLSRGAKTTGRSTRIKGLASSSSPSAHSDRIMDLEDENKSLKYENQTLRGLMLDGYIAKEPHPKLRRIGQILRDAGSNQIQRIMEIVLVAEGGAPMSGESSSHSELAIGSDDSNGLPRHPSGSFKLRRKADQNA